MCVWVGVCVCVCVCVWVGEGVWVHVCVVHMHTQTRESQSFIYTILRLFLPIRIQGFWDTMGHISQGGCACILEATACMRKRKASLL